MNIIDICGKTCETTKSKMLSGSRSRGYYDAANSFTEIIRRIRILNADIYFVLENRIANKL